MAMKGKIEGAPVPTGTWSTEECWVSLERVDTGMEVDLRSDSDSESVSSRTRNRLERGAERRAPPSPACSKVKRGTRSRSLSATRASSSSGDSKSTDQTTTTRRSRKRADFEANRRVAEATASGREEGPNVVVLSDNTEEEEEFFSPSQSREPSLKRKMEMGEGEEVQGATQRKQGRPPKTGDYVGRSEAVRELVELERERAHLEVEKTLRNMTTGQVFANIERDLEAAIEEVEYSPTADLASRARDCMAQVMKVAKGSKNLQGGYVKLLKQAAVMGAATAEVLRTRADRGGENDSDLSRQVKNMSRELAVVKREVLAAREEAEYLRRKLSEERERATRTTRRRVIKDDFPPSVSKGEEGRSPGLRVQGLGRVP